MSTEELKKDVEIVEEVDITEIVKNSEESEEINDDNISEENTFSYSALSKSELVAEFETILNSENVFSRKSEIESIRALFYKKHRAEIELKKQQLVNDDVDIEEIDFSNDEEESKLKELYNNYKQQKADFVKNQEEQKNINLEKKRELIEDIKNLINNEESLNKTFNEFHEIQRKWKEIGTVPQSELNNLWESYNLQVENFYNYIKINKELRDLDLKKNLEAKIELCEKTEELIIEESVKKAAELLQEYHDLWREIGPVPSDKKEEIWLRFKDATTKINKKHQEFYLNLKNEQENNLTAKEAICEEVEKIAEIVFETSKEWLQNSNRIIELQNLWKTIGFAPKKYNQKVYERFRTACDLFFNKKKDFFNSIKEEQNNNLQKKIDICMVAESLQESTEWKETTNELIKLQKDWKKIGHVSKKHSEVVWKRFRAACDTFFNRKEDYFKNLDKNLEQNLVLKNQLLEKIVSFVPSDDNKSNLESLKAFQKEWSDIGHVPMSSKDDIQSKYRNAINAQFEKLNIDKKKKDIIIFKQEVENLKDNKSKNQLNSKREKLIKDIKQLEADISLLENNIGFFSKSKNADKLISEFSEKINKAKEQLIKYYEQIKIIDNI